ncbi:MAG: hypothetical protein FJ261_09055 [Planctomycetes bacterium]|nr:hypothetical protein [Planctomycetota bacterium]
MSHAARERPAGSASILSPVRPGLGAVASAPVPWQTATTSTPGWPAAHFAKAGSFSWQATQSGEKQYTMAGLPAAVTSSPSTRARISPRSSAPSSSTDRARALA